MLFFYEEVFPFIEFHPNVGACFQAEINLLPAQLIPSSNIDPRGFNYTGDQLLQTNLIPVTNGENPG
jgi:hypothetical protein